MSEFERITLNANGLTFSAHATGSGPTVICLHGFPDHKGSFRYQLPALASGGFRAVSPTLRGYEPSAQPKDGDYSVVRMAEDVVGWIDDLRQDQVHLIGHDWGAVIGYATAALAPDRLYSLTTMAVPHPGRMQREGLRQVPSQLRNSWYMFFFQLRGIADAVVEARDWALIDKLWRDWSPGWDPGPETVRAVKDTLAQPGVKKAALGYYRAAFSPWNEGAKRTAELMEIPIQVPTLAFTGALDGCIDTRLYDYSMSDEDFPAGLRVERIDKAGHFLHQECPEEVNRLLLEWLGGNG